MNAIARVLKRLSLSVATMLRAVMRNKAFRLSFPVVLCGLALSGCVTTQQGTRTTVAGNVCGAWRKITYDSGEDTQETVRQILIHNKTGVNLKCWRK